MRAMAARCHQLKLSRARRSAITSRMPGAFSPAEGSADASARFCVRACSLSIPRSSLSLPRTVCSPVPFVRGKANTATGRRNSRQSGDSLLSWSATAGANPRIALSSIRGFAPVVVGYGGTPAPQVEEIIIGGADVTLAATDTIGIVTVHDGAPLESGEIIAPEVRADHRDHNYFQDPENFLALGGRRGKQLQVLTDGTFFINRWFAAVEVRPKTRIPIGYVGVVVSYYGSKGEDVTGTGFRYGEQVEPGQRGVWKQALPPGKYPVNPYAVKVELVPTVNFVLRWITGQAEAHQYDKDLVSIALITADGYEPVLPLSLVLHIDYEKAPRVIQRFGDVRRLISQTLDPILSAYFRDVAQSSSMLDLLTKREDIQRRATAELGKRFAEFDINCVAVLIGRPESKVKNGQPDPIDRLFDQLRQRRLADEQRETFGK